MKKSPTILVLAAMLLPVSCARSQQQPAAAAPKPAPAMERATYRVVNLLPDYWEFWAKAKDLSPDEQFPLFKSMVIAHHPEAYAASVIGLDESKPYDEELAKRYTRYYGFVSPHFETMRRVSGSITRDLPRYEAKFRETFPDLRYTGDVYFMNSLGGFDGATRTVNGKTVLMFGVDVIAAVYGDSIDPQPFFHHELFHIYHRQFTGEEKGGSDPIFAALWREGLATYVAKALNPSAQGINLFGLPLDMPRRAEAMLPELAGGLLDVLDSTKEEDYKRYFWGSNGEEKIPSRSGYYVGFKVAEKLVERRSLQDLAHSKIESLRPEIEQALKALAVHSSEGRVSM